MGQINFLAVLAATLASFVLGGLWYSPLMFDKAWRKAAELSDQDMNRYPAPIIFAIAFVFTFLMALNLAYLLSAPGTTLSFALLASLAAGLGFATFGLGVVALFERRQPGYLLINGGYLTLSFLLMGLVLGLWR